MRLSGNGVVHSSHGDFLLEAGGQVNVLEFIEIARVLNVKASALMAAIEGYVHWWHGSHPDDRQAHSLISDALVTSKHVFKPIPVRIR